jgi:small ligand-binding sensory domain FIST
VPFVAALSAHPLAAHAAGEVVGHVLEQLPGPVDLAVLLVSGAHGQQFEQIAAVVRATLAPSRLIGATAIGVLGGERQVVEHPAIALWAGASVDAEVVRLGEAAGATAPLDAVDRALAAVGDRRDGAGSTLVLLAEPTFPLDHAREELVRSHPDLAVAGGVVAAGVRPGATALLADEDIVTAGAVGLLVGPATPTAALVSRGFRPIGVPLVVTRADGPVIRDLAGRPILDRLDELLLGLDDAEAAAVGRGLHLGQVLDEHQASFGAGDFVVRRVAAVDRAGRTLTVEEPDAGPVEVGTTVQFLVQDEVGADEDLRAELAGRRAQGALSLVTLARESLLLADPDRDAGLVSTIVDGQAHVGVVCSLVVTPTGSPAVDPGPTAVVVLVGSSEADGAAR